MYSLPNVFITVPHVPHLINQALGFYRNYLVGKLPFLILLVFLVFDVTFVLHFLFSQKTQLKRTFAWL